MIFNLIINNKYNFLKGGKMKNYFIKNMLSNGDNKDLEKLTYGLDIIYISFTKLIFIISASLMFNCLYITLYCIFLISFIRGFSYGLHMKNSVKCYLFSFLIFVLLPKFFIYTNISKLQVFILFMLCVLSFIMYSPSDTNKRPLINEKKRKTLKYMSLVILFLYIIIYLYVKDINLSKTILYSVVIQSILINPIAYKLFNLSYGNFKEVMK